MFNRLLRTFLFVVCSGGAISLYAAKTSPAPLNVTFDGNLLVVRDAAPGAPIVFFGVARVMAGPLKATPRIVNRTEIVPDDDSDGIVRLDLEELPRIGLWAIVDLSTGASAIVPVPGFDPRPLDLGDLVKHDNAGHLRKVDWPSAELELLVVRPGSGAWRLDAAKYSQLDESRNPHVPMRVDIGTLTPVGHSPASPQAFKPGDVLVLIDASRMTHAMVEVGE